MKGIQVTIDLKEANEFFQYGHHIMELSPERLMACACYVIAMLMKLNQPRSVYSDQLLILNKYILEELLPNIVVTGKDVKL